MIFFENENDPQEHYHVAVSQAYFSQNRALKCVLGSCVSVIIMPTSPELTYSSLSHYLLASPEENTNLGDEDKYGSILLEKQISNMLKRHKPQNLRAMVFGGSQGSEHFKARVISDIGANNVRTALNMLGHYRIEVIARNTGGNYSRFIEYYPLKKYCLVKVLKENENFFYSLKP